MRATYLWPLLLIGFGIALIAGGRRVREEPPPAEPEPEPGEPREPEPGEPREPEPGD